MTSKLPVTALAACCAVVVLALVACRPPTDPTTTTSELPSPAPSSTTPAQPLAARGVAPAVVVPGRR